MGKSEHTLSKQDTVCTPEAIWRPIVEALGPIGLDPCSHPASTVPAQTRFLLHDYWTDPSKPPPEVEECGDHDVMYVRSGLAFAWAGCGLVYVNPPYSTLGKEAWIEKAQEADEAALFVPVRTATRWWQERLVFCRAITFLAARVTHDNVFDKKGEPTDDPSPFGQALVYCGPRVELWCEKIGPLGWTVVLGASR